MTVRREYYAEGFHGGIYCLATVDTVHDLLRKVLTALDSDDEYTVNLELEGFTWAMLGGELRPRFCELLGRLKHYLDAGRVELTTSYTQPFFAYVDGETVVRQLLRAQTVVDELFGKRMVTYATQEPLFTTQLPQLLKGTGFQHTVLRSYWPLYGDASPVYEQKIWWVGPDGSRIETVPTYPDRHRIEDPLGHELFDFQPHKVQRSRIGQSPDEADALHTTYHEYFANTPEPRRTVSYTPESLMISSYPTSLDHVPSVLPFPWGLMGGLVQRYCRDAEKALLSTEILASLLALGAEISYPAAQLEDAWEKLLLSQHHDLWVCPVWDVSSGAYAAGRLVDRGAAWSSEVKETCSHLTGELLDCLGECVRAEPSFRPENYPFVIPIIVFTTLGEPVSEVAAVEAPLPCGQAEALVVVDSTGRELPTETAANSAEPEDGTRMAKTTFLAESIPSLGYKTFYLAPGASGPGDLRVDAGDGWVEAENECYRLRLDLSQGGALASLYDKEMDEEFIDSSVGLGNTFVARVPESAEMMRSTDRPAALRNCEAGPLKAQVQLDGRLHNWPYRLDVSLYRATKRVEFEVTLDIPPGTAVGASGEAITDDLRDEEGVWRGDCFRYGGWWDTPVPEDVEWRFNRDKLRVCFPLAIGDGMAYRDAPFEVAAADREAFVMLNWVDVSDGEKGFALFSDRTAACLYANGELSMVLAYGGAYRYANDKKLLLGGSYRYAYALTTHRGAWHEARIPHLSARYNHPPLTRAVAPGGGPLPGEMSLISMEPPDPLLAAASGHGGKVYLRLLDLYNNRRRVHLGVPEQAGGPSLVEIDGSDARPAQSTPTSHGRETTVDMERWRLATISVPCGAVGRARTRL